MYIPKTTAEERDTITDTMDGIFVEITKSREVLMQIMSDYFDDVEQKAICALDAETIGAALYLINGSLWMAELLYSLTTGRDDAAGCPSYYDGIKTATLARDVERLRTKLPLDDTAPYRGLDDAAALPILQEISKKKGIR